MQCRATGIADHILPLGDLLVIEPKFAAYFLTYGLKAHVVQLSLSVMKNFATDWEEVWSHARL